MPQLPRILFVTVLLQEPIFVRELQALKSSQAYSSYFEHYPRESVL